MYAYLLGYLEQVKAKTPAIVPPAAPADQQGPPVSARSQDTMAGLGPIQAGEMEVESSEWDSPPVSGRPGAAAFVPPVPERSSQTGSNVRASTSSKASSASKQEACFHLLVSRRKRFCSQDTWSKGSS